MRRGENLHLGPRADEGRELALLYLVWLYSSCYLNSPFKGELLINFSRCN
jgi:hypothetical protein